MFIHTTFEKVVLIEYRHYHLLNLAKEFPSTCRGLFPTRYMTAEGKALKEQYQWEARAQWQGKPLEGDVEVSITVYFGTKRKADLDNFNKLSLDALTGIAYGDDSQIAGLYLKRAYDKAHPRIEVTIKSINSPAAVGE